MIRLLELYRITSILLALSIYIINGINEHYSVSGMLFMVLCIIVSAFLLMYLYRLSFDTMWRLYFLLFVEITGISLLIIPTGGLTSPFIWYFLNPLLIISYYLQPKEKAFFLTANFMILFAAGYYKSSTPAINDYILSHSNIILSCVLILILVNILFSYNKVIVRINEQLESSNERIKSLIDDILFIYEAVQSVSNQKGRREVLNILLEFVEKISPKAQAIFLLNDRIVSLVPISTETKDALAITIKKNNSAISKEDVFSCVLETKERVILTRVSNISDYGIIGLILPENAADRDKNDYIPSLLFFSKLGALLLEKIELEAVNHELAIAEEQNRIAGDIHDSVVQRLFAVSCMTYDILNKWEQIPDNKKKEQITLFKETVQSSLKDLRSTIYNLSSKKQQIDLFKESLSSYLLDMEKLSGTKISLDINGAYDSLSTAAKKAMYRIIIESTGNAIKHGKCRNVWVKLSIGDSNTYLTIKDDGTGFDPAENEAEKNITRKSGMGLYNIKSLVRILNGHINITSTKEAGTTIEISFANADIMQT